MNQFFSQFQTPSLFQISFDNDIIEALSSFDSIENYPPSEMIAFEDKLSMNVAVAGFKKEDLTITFTQHNRMLTIQGDRSKTSETGTVIYSKIAKRKFSFSQRISTEYDESTIQTSLTDGILSVTLSKKEKPEPKVTKIEIK